MAIADYFQRNVTAASQLLCGLDNAGLLKILRHHRIALAVDDAPNCLEGQAAADMVIRLLARFYPKLAIVALDPKAQTHASELITLAKAINPKIHVATNLDAATHCIVIGRTVVALKKATGRVIYVGSNNWLANLSTKKPVGSGNSANPFGAGAAACLGVAKLFRLVFAKQLDPASATDEEVALSLLTLDGKDRKRGLAYRSPKIGRTYLAGAGAIGNGALWALARSGAKGELKVIDPQTIELSNLQRYVMTVQKDVGAAKPERAQHWLAEANGLTVAPYQQSWDDHAHASDWRFPRVLVALDSAEARIGVQASLPKWIINSWTRESSIGISRHLTLDNDGGSCLACLYLPEGKAPNEDELVASALGFSTDPPHNGNPEIMDIRQRLDRNVLNDRAFLEKIAERKGLEVDDLLQFEGQPLRKLYVDGVCGGRVMGLVVDARETRGEVPMAFQSALAGVLLAAELVIDVLKLRTKRLPETTRIELLEPLRHLLSTPSGKNAAGRCLCQDEDYQARYVEKYS